MKNSYLLCLAVLLSVSCGREKVTISQDIHQWLIGEARRQLEGCTITAHDGTVLYTPDGQGHYAALWTRDFAYMVENAFHLLPKENVRRAMLYLLNSQREDGCIPDRLQADGLAVYSAGPVGHPLGDPPTDNSQFMVKLVADYVAHTGDLDFFRNAADKLVAAMNYTPRSPDGLVYIDPAAPHSPYGFTDTIAKTGELLFSSLLYWEACQRLVVLFNQITEPKLAEEFDQRSLMIESHLDKLWDNQAGMFLAATQDCRQIDIWGNAYAIYIDFPLMEKRGRIVEYLAANFDKYVHKGQIRHLPAPEHWQKTLIPVEPETYQNGAYWGTASGWLAFALADKHPALAKRILDDLLADYRQNGAYECINRDYAKLKDYVVSVTNPLGAIERMAK